MSNSEEEIRIKQISEILEAVRKGVDELRARVPGLMRLKSIDEISPEENQEFFYKSMFSVFWKYETGVNVPGLMPPIIPKKYGEIFKWHEKCFLPVHRKMKELFMNQFLPGILRGSSLMEPLIREVVQWENNETALPPIVTERDIGKIPAHIFERLTQIHRSFVFRNWIAAIALSRCLLEYAIVEQRYALDIEVYAGKKKRVRWLSDLIEEVGNIHPKLVAPMDQIKTAGDWAMHPPEENAERKLPEEDEAKKCYKDIREIIAVLYGK